MSSIEDRFIVAVQEAYQRAQSGSVRSTERIRVLHGWVQKEIVNQIGDAYEVCGLNDNRESREEKVQGWYYPKNVDVSVKRDDNVIGVVSFKLVNSNYKQNANNYFENQMGETANLRRNNIVFGNIFCMTEPIPYKTRSGGLKKYEHIRGSDIMKYRKLENDHNHLHAPDVQALVVVRLNKEKGLIERICTREDLDFLNDDEYKILTAMGFERFFRLFTNSVKNKYDFLKGA